MSAQKALGKLIFMANPYSNPDDVIMPSDPSEIEMEEDNYAAQWAFKGQTQNIKRALRVQYRYKKKNKAGDTYVVTEHLLVGFAGSNGG